MAKLVIVTHPNIEGSFINRLWVDELSNFSDKLNIRPIYKLYPDQVIDVEAEQKLLMEYDEIIFQFPLHWFNVPFYLKQYIDQVFAFGWAFGPGGDKMKGKKIRMAVSTGGTKETYENLVTLDELLKPMYVTFQYCGCDILPTHKFYGAGANPLEVDVVVNAKEYAALIK